MGTNKKTITTIETIHRKANEFINGLPFGTFDSLSDENKFRTMLGIFAVKFLSDNAFECERLREALAKTEKGIAQKNAEPIGKKPKFKVGDKVRITHNVPYWEHNGKVRVINLITKDGKYGLSGVSGLWEEHCLTPFEPQEDIKYMNVYQERAMSTCMPSCDNFTYMLTELNAEVGEINDKIAKWRRKGIASIKDNDLVFSTSELDEARDYLTDVALELGDVLWAVSGLARTLGFDLETIGQMNILKLADRKRRGVIDGTGDNR